MPRSRRLLEALPLGHVLSAARLAEHLGIAVGRIYQISASLRAEGHALTHRAQVWFGSQSTITAHEKSQGR